MRAQTFRQVRLYLRNGLAGMAVFFLLSAAGRAQTKPAGQPSEFPWAQELDKYPGLVPEFGNLLGKLKDNVQLPAARTATRLLPLLPGSTMFFVAFPNYGNAAHQTLETFRNELQESEVLRKWWAHGDLATAGPKIIRSTSTSAKKSSSRAPCEGKLLASLRSRKSASRA